MEIETLIKKRQYIYHLTSRENVDLILNNRKIDSTVKLITNSNLDDNEKTAVLTTRRVGHFYINNANGDEVMIRDQNPISIKSLNKCLTDGWSSEDFLYHLNNRVFFWPTLKRLNIHFEKYKEEKPIIFRCLTEDMLALNDNIKLCHLNSGATRCHHMWGGAPPPRGADTFVDIKDFDYPVGRLAEVTFEESCILPETLWISDNPNGEWNKV